MLKVEGDVIFREGQHFRQLWLWALVLLFPALCAYALIQQVFLDKPFGNNPASDSLLIGSAVVFGLGFPLLFLVAKLTTEVREDGLYLRFVPFHRSFRKIAWEDLARYEVRTYRPLRDYGGWGIRYGSQGKAYNVRGNRGVQLHLSNGKRLLIGSQRPEELAEALDLAMRKRQLSAWT